jgi:hypothetical protein
VRLGIRSVTTYCSLFARWPRNWSKASESRREDRELIYLPLKMTAILARNRFSAHAIASLGVRKDMRVITT